MQPVSNNHVKSQTGVYLPLTIGRRKCLGLVDTGSEVTLVPQSLVKGAQLSPSKQHLRAANGSEIVVRGEARLMVRMGSLTVPMECVVVENVAEVLLGMDWLTRNVEQLDLRRRSVRIAGREMPLRGAAWKRPPRGRPSIRGPAKAKDLEGGGCELPDADVRLTTDRRLSHSVETYSVETSIYKTGGCYSHRNKKMATSRGGDRRVIEWDDYRTRDGYRCPECGNRYELKDSFRKHFNHKHGTGTTNQAERAVNAVRRSSLPESGHAERDRKRSHSTDDRRRGESRAATASADRKKDRREAKEGVAEDALGVLETFDGVVTIDLPGYNPEDPRMDPTSQLPPAQPPATGVIYQPTPIHPSVVQAVSMVMAAAGRDLATQSADDATLGQELVMELGKPADSPPDELAQEKTGEVDAPVNPAGESGTNVAAEVVSKVAKEVDAVHPTEGAEARKETPRLHLTRVSVSEYQRRAKSQGNSEAEGSRPPKATVTATTLTPDAGKATERPTKEAKDPPRNDGGPQAGPEEGAPAADRHSRHVHDGHRKRSRRRPGRSASQSQRRGCSHVARPRVVRGGPDQGAGHYRCRAVGGGPPRRHLDQ